MDRVVLHMGLENPRQFYSLRIISIRVAGSPRHLIVTYMSMLSIVTDNLSRSELLKQNEEKTYLFDKGESMGSLRASFTNCMFVGPV